MRLAVILLVAALAIASIDAQAVPSVFEKVGPYIILSYRVNADHLRRALNNSNIIIDTYEGSAWVTITLEDNFIDFGDSGVIPATNFVAETKEVAVRTYARVRDPTNPTMYLKGTVGGYFNHANPTVCATTVSLIHAVWGVSCESAVLEYERYRVGSRFHMEMTHGAGSIELDAVQGDAIANPTVGLTGFFTDPERNWEFGWDAGNKTVHVLKHDPYVIYDIHVADIQSFSSNLVSTLSGGLLRDPSGFAVRGTALWAMRYDQPFTDFYIIN